MEKLTSEITYKIFRNAVLELQILRLSGVANMWTEAPLLLDVAWNNNMYGFVNYFTGYMEGTHTCSIATCDRNCDKSGDVSFKLIIDRTNYFEYLKNAENIGFPIYVELNRLKLDNLFDMLDYMREVETSETAQELFKDDYEDRIYANDVGYVIVLLLFFQSKKFPDIKIIDYIRHLVWRIENENYDVKYYTSQLKSLLSEYPEFKLFGLDTIYPKNTVDC